MINRAVVVGRLTKDPELRKTTSGKSVVQFNLACNRNKSSEGQPEADFINCVAWNKTADTMQQYLHKGDLIGIEGRIQTRNYQDNSGRTVHVTEVIIDSMQFLQPKQKENQPQNQQQYSAPQTNSYQQSYQAPQQQGYQYQQEPLYQPPQNNAYGSGDTLDISSDDLPF